MAGDAECDVRQCGSRQCPIFSHTSKGNHPAVAAAAGDLEVVVAKGSDLSGQNKGSIVRWLQHG